jgi:DNA-binding transcriptional MocR family regulator
LNGLALGYAGIPPADIHKGMQRLAQAIDSSGVTFS